MEITRDNHYVSQLYIKQWSDDDLHIWSYRTLVSHENVPKWAYRSINNTAYLRDLYTEMDDEKEVDRFEKWLQSEFENPVQLSMEKALKDNPLSSSDWECLVNFLAAQDVRTPLSYLKSVERLKETLPTRLQETLEKSVRMLEKKKDLPKVESSPNDDSQLFTNVLKVDTVLSDESEDDQAYIRAGITIGRSLWLDGQRHLLTDTIKELKKHKWCIVRPASGFQWFTSDQPVVKLNYYSQDNYDLNGGWGKKNGNIFMPISPRHLLFTEIGADLPDSQTFSSDMTRQFQRFIAENAYKWIFAHKKLGFIEKLRPRYVDADTFKNDEEQWRNWHKIQNQAEK